MKTLLIEGCNFENFPVGGQLSFCKQVIQCFDHEFLLLVGMTNSTNEPVGKWFYKNINGKMYKSFNLYRLSKCEKPLIPLRIINLLSVIYYFREISRVAINKNVFIQSPELLIGLNLLRFSSKKSIYIFHGVENPLKNPRYKWGKIFSFSFWKLLILSASKCDVLLAAASPLEIRKKFINTTVDNKVQFFPTRYDDHVFNNLKSNVYKPPIFENFDKIIITTGRINNVKGWDFLVRSFHKYINTYSINACLIFVGSGEDLESLNLLINKLNLSERVFITGFVPKEKVAYYLSFSDLYIVGSKHEGWSIAMLEALACGLPIVSTQVSGCHDLIANDLNGYVCEERNESKFAELIHTSIKFIPPNNSHSLFIASKFKLSDFKNDLFKYI